MSKINSTVEVYLNSSEATSALMITGEWGSGKTFYYFNSIEPIILSKKLNPIYISLNGISSQEQLRSLILSKTILKKNIGPKWKATFENIKNRVAAVIGKIEKADLFLSFFNISDFIHPESDVFCFDDLERISKNLPVEDVLGFVNSELVEHKKCKVIFIGDETKRQLTESEYLKAKEKVIGWTTHYQPDIENIFELILPNFQHNLKFHLFLKKHQPFIVKLINSFDCNNLRTINFFLDCLKNIFSAYNNFNNDSIERDLIYFTLIISIEHKKGNLSIFRFEKNLPNYITRNKQQIYLFDDLLPSNQTRNLETEKTNHEQAVNLYESDFTRYISNGWLMITENDVEYVFLESIFEFITNGYLDQSKLTKEINFISSIRRSKKPSNEMDLITKLAFYRNHSNEEFINTFNEVKKLIEKGALDIYEFARASAIILNLDKLGILPKQLEKTEVFLLKNASIARDKTIHALEGFEENYSDDVFEQVGMHSAKLCSELTSIHEKIKKEQIIKRIKNKFDLWKDYIDDKDLFVAIIQNIDAIEIYNYIIDNLNNRTFLEKLYLAIRDSHRKTSIHYLKGYSISLQTLGKKLEEAYNSNSFTIIDNYWIKSLMDKVNEIAKFLDSEKIQ